MKKNRLTLALAGLLIAGSAVTGLATYARADTGTPRVMGQMMHKGQKPVAVGAVTAISGTTLTITDAKSGATYAVEAGSASVEKHEKPTSKGTKPVATNSTLSSIVVGDVIRVSGTLSGSTVTATKIDVGTMGHSEGRDGMGRGIHGTVTSVSNGALTVTGSDGKVYTVTTTGATASKTQTMDIANIAVGDSVGIRGEIMGTTVTAKHIMNGIPLVPSK